MIHDRKFAVKELGSIEFADREFAELVLPAVGHYAVGTFTKTVQGETIPVFRFTTDVASFVALSRQQDTKLNNTVYFGTASLLTNDGNRLKDLCAKQCFHVDIDVGYPGFVQTQQEAIADLYRLCDVAMIPPPSIVVSSGYGVHAYWSLTYAFTTKDIQQWQQLANGLRNAAIEHTPKIAKDTSKWTSRTALLRLPGTTNKKQSSGVPVEIIGGTFERYPRYYFEPLKRYEPEEPIIRQPGKREIAQLSGEALKATCAVIRDLSLRGGDFGYYAWRDLIHYSHHLTDGVQWAHDMSKGDRYDADGTDRLYDYYVERYEAGDYRPSRCTTLCASAGLQHEDICRRCPLFMAGKTPLHLSAARPLAPTAVTDVAVLPLLSQRNIDLPTFIGAPIENTNSEYLLRNDAVLVRRPIRPDENDKGGDLFSNAWWVEGKFDDNNITYYEIATVEDVEETREDGLHAFVPRRIRYTKTRGDTFAEPRALPKGLALAGVRVSGTSRADREHAWNYAMVAVEHCRTISVTASSFGWQADGRFVLGKGAFNADGGIEAIALSGLLKEKDNETRKLATHAVNQLSSELGVIAAVKSYNDHASPLGKALFLAALSAPLYDLVGLDGYTILLYGEGGKGKTSLQRLFSCLYGAPDAGMIRGTDTLASWDATRGLYKSLPVTFDEFTNAGKGTKSLPDEADKDHFIMTTSEGRSKKVGAPDQRQRGGSETWATLVIGSSNTDYVNSVNARLFDARADAILARFSQINISEGVIERAHWSGVETLFEQNHGLIGAKFMTFVAPNKEDIKERLRSLTDIGSQNVAQEARFRVKALSCAYIAQDILKAQGLADFGLKLQDLGRLLELHRLDPSRIGGNEWNRRAVDDTGSDANIRILRTIIHTLSNRLVKYVERSPNQFLPSGLPVMNGTVAGTNTKMLNGDTVYALSTDEIMRSPLLKEFAAVMPGVLKALPQALTALTEDGVAIPCVLIRARNGSIVYQTKTTSARVPTPRGINDHAKR